jgi:hypothetical protein
MSIVQLLRKEFNPLRDFEKYESISEMIEESDNFGRDLLSLGTYIGANFIKPTVRGILLGGIAGTVVYCFQDEGSYQTISNGIMLGLIFDYIQYLPRLTYKERSVIRNNLEED